MRTCRPWGIEKAWIGSVGQKSHWAGGIVGERKDWETGSGKNFLKLTLYGQWQINTGHRCAVYVCLLFFYDLWKQTVGNDLVMSVFRCICCLSLRLSKKQIHITTPTTYLWEWLKSSKIWQYQVLMRLQSNKNNKSGMQNMKATLETSIAISNKAKHMTQQLCPWVFTQLIWKFLST